MGKGRQEVSQGVLIGRTKWGHTLQRNNVLMQVLTSRPARIKFIQSGFEGREQAHVENPGPQAMFEDEGSETENPKAYSSRPGPNFLYSPSGYSNSSTFRNC